MWAWITHRNRWPAMPPHRARPPAPPSDPNAAGQGGKRARPNRVQVCAGHSIAAGEQRHFVTEVNQFLDQPVTHAPVPPYSSGNTFSQRRDLSNPHASSDWYSHRSDQELSAATSSRSRADAGTSRVARLHSLTVASPRRASPTRNERCIHQPREQLRVPTNHQPMNCAGPRKERQNKLIGIERLSERRLNRREQRLNSQKAAAPPPRGNNRTPACIQSGLLNSCVTD